MIWFKASLNLGSVILTSVIVMKQSHAIFQISLSPVLSYESL